MTILERIPVASGYEIRRREIRDYTDGPHIVTELVRLGPRDVALADVPADVRDLRQWALRVIAQYELAGGFGR
jgi:hypothetical protein